METTRDQHGNTVLVFTEVGGDGTPVRLPQNLRITIPQHGGPWAVAIRDANGNPRAGMWVSTPDVRALGQEITGQEP